MTPGDKLLGAVARHTSAVLTEMLLGAGQIERISNVDPKPPPSAATWTEVCEVAVSEGAYTVPLELCGPTDTGGPVLRPCPRCEGRGVVRHSG